MKAYDLSELGKMVIDQAKIDGLEIAEEALEKLGKSVYLGWKNWKIESAQISETKVDDFTLPLYVYLDQFALPQIEKIDIDGDGK
jgi:hypothetical protein